jgi:hypothetical protein
LTGGILSGAGAMAGTFFSKASDTIRDILSATDESAVQNALQDHVRDVLSKTAADAGVAAPTAPSLRDGFTELAKNVEAKASAFYSKIDEALRTPGNTYTTNYKRFDQGLRNVRRELAMSTGINPEADTVLIEREAALVDAKTQAQQTATSKGVPADTAALGDRFWAQSRALQDCAKALQKSTIGLRPELTTTEGAASPETVTQSLASKLNDLYNKGRLQQALTPAHADDLLRSVEIANRKARQTAAANVAVKSITGNAIGTAAKSVGVGAGIGAGAIGGYEGVKHYLNP